MSGGSAGGPRKHSDANDEFLSEIFDLAVRRHATGEEFGDLDELVSGRPHLREDVMRVIDLAREVAVVEAPRVEAPPAPVIAGFMILEEVGRGGVGVVYRAREEGLGRIVALKCLAPSLTASVRARERFVVEAQSLARVQHPHVVTIHKVIAESALCAYAMEWVDGTTLSNAIAGKDSGLDVPAVARLGAAMGRALGAVHEAGLIHRDVKPSNILLRKDGTPLLSDFSLAYDSDHSLHTGPGQFVGTAAYAAPEQLLGRNEDVGAWTDVYALGVTLYAALTGRTPFGTSSTAEMLRRIEIGLAMPITKFNPCVPRDLATIVAKAMDPEPARRYPTAGEMADDLDRLLRFEPIRARRVGVGTRFLRLARRNRAAFAAATIAALLVLALAAAFGVSWKRRLEVPGRFREELRQARSSLIDPHINHRFFVAVNNSGAEAWAVPLPPLDVIDRALEGYRRAIALVPEDEAAALEYAVVSVSRALLARDRSMPTAAEPLRTRCPTTFRVAGEWIATGRPRDVDLPGVDRLHAVDRRHLGLLAFLCTRVALCIEAWDALAAEPDRDDPLVAGALGEAWLVMDRPALAVPRLERARKEFPECGSLTLDLADALVRTGDLARAEAMLALAKQLPNHPSEPTRVEADLCAARGQNERALALYYGLIPRPPTATFHLSRSLAAKGDRAAAFDCVGTVCVPYPSVGRYQAFLLGLLDPVFSQLGLDEQAEVVAAAAHGRHQHVPLYAIGAVMRDRGWLHAPSERDPNAQLSVGLRDLTVTREVMKLLSAPTWRERPRDSRALVRVALLTDSVFRQSRTGRAIGLAVSRMVRSGAPKSGPGLSPRFSVSPWEQRADPPDRPAVASPGKDVGISNVAAAGDVDRDGCSDVLVGDPGALEGRGITRLFSGRSGQVLHTFTGNADWRLGQSLAAAGDVDRDGNPDLLIGARGLVLVCSGRDGSVIRTLSGRNHGDGFGVALASAGDIDRDGSPDVLVGAPSGYYALVFSGRTGAVLRFFEGLPGFAASVDGGHDADGDGIPDLLIGSPGEQDPGLMANGRASLFSGATGSLLWTEGGPTSMDCLGTSVAFLGDINGDGMTDWAAGAPGDRDPYYPMGAGHVRIYAGPHGALLRTVGGSGAWTGGFGRGVGPAGDVDRDGIPDLMVAADLSSQPDVPCYIELFSPGNDFALIRRLPLAFRVGPRASMICGNVDVDGDGTPDVLIGTAGPSGFARISLGSDGR